MLFKKKDNKDYYTAGVEKFKDGEYKLAMEFFQAELDKNPKNNDALEMLAKTYGKLGNNLLQKQTLAKIQHPKTSPQPSGNKLVKIKKNNRKKKWTQPKLADYLLWITGGILLLIMLFLIIHFREGLKYPYGAYFFGYALCIFIVVAIIGSVSDDSDFDSGSIMALLTSPLAVWVIIKCVGTHPVVLVIVFFVITGLCCFLEYRSKEEETRRFFFTSGVFCAVWSLFFLIPVVWKPIAEHQIAKAEERLDASQIQIHKYADRLRTQRQSQKREAGFMGLMIGDSYDDVLAKCQSSESIISKTNNHSYNDEMVRGMHFDSVLRVNALWDNKKVDAALYFHNSVLSAIHFGLFSNDSIINTYECKYGKPEINVKWEKTESFLPSYIIDKNRRFPYYCDLYQKWNYARNAIKLDTIEYSWTFKNVSISIEKTHWEDYWNVEYVASWVADSVEASKERERINREMERRASELRKKEEQRVKDSAEAVERKRRESSHKDATKNI